MHLGADSQVGPTEGRADLMIPANSSWCVSNYEESPLQIAADASDELISKDLRGVFYQSSDQTTAIP